MADITVLKNLTINNIKFKERRMINMFKITNGLYIDEVEILKDELERYKTAISEYLNERGYMVEVKWEDDRMKYSYSSNPFSMDRHITGEEMLTPEQMSIINGFNKVISYYEAKNQNTKPLN